MSDRDDDAFIERFRARVQKTLKDCEELIALSGHIAKVRPDVAPHAAPDTLTNIYATRDWARKALAAIDAGEQIPPVPDMVD